MYNPAFQQSDSPLLAFRWLDALLGWLTRHDKAALLAGVGFQVVVLVSLIVTPYTTFVSGDTILLHVVPVDPRDLFRGDYVILRYEFSRFGPQDIPGLSSTDNRDQTVYVALVPDTDGKHWRASQYLLKKPASGKFLRGRIKDRNLIEFGIESYFVQEGQGSSYESAVRSGTLSAEVALDGNGKAVLRRLVIN